MLELVKKTIMAGAGLAVLTAEKLEEIFDELVKKGEVSEKEAKEAISELVERSKAARKDLEEWMEGVVAKVLKRLNIPTRAEVDELKSRIEQLERAREGEE